MNVQQLAAYLSGLPAKYQNQPVLINGWGSDEGTAVEVSGAFGDRDGVCLGHGGTDWQTGTPRIWYMMSDRLASTAD